MKKLFFTLLSIASLGLMVSCGPEAFLMNIQTRQPSVSGLDLTGKTISVVYTDDAGRDSTFSAYVANGFAEALEEDYFDGKEAINVYKMEKDKNGNYASRDTMLNLVMDTGDDVIFLFDSPKFGNAKVGARQVVAGKDKNSRIAQVAIPFQINLYVYDALGADSVRTFKGSSTLREAVLCNTSDTDDQVVTKVWSELDEVGEKTGKNSATTFLSEWADETMYFIYYDAPSTWNKAAEEAYNFQWQKAINDWMTLLDAKDPERRSCAEYNIAGALYLLGDYDLAKKWIDLSLRESDILKGLPLKNKIYSKLTK